MEFIRETIKDKPINKKRVAIQVGTAALCGFVFALTAVIVFVCFLPGFQEMFGQSPEQSGENLEQADNYGTENATEEGNASVIPEDTSLSISDYQQLQNELYAIGNEANRSIVTVTSQASETDWMNNSYETLGHGSGVIISEDDRSLYILTERKNIMDGASIKVTFMNDTSADAALLKYDANTGITILTVDKNRLENRTKNAIKVAVIGDSYSVKKGTLVVALGNPLGTNYSILTGNITSTNHKIHTPDKNYSVFTTDIVANENGSGILINTAGEIVGVVIRDFAGLQGSSTLTAVAVSEVEALIQMLLQGKDNPYFGLYISTVTDKISGTFDIPKGVFIREVATDSPAMLAGLQSGDVIVKMNGEEVSTDIAYSSELSQMIPGIPYELMVKRQNGDGYYEITCNIEAGILK